MLDGHVADTLIVTARSAGGSSDREGIRLFLVDPKAAGVEITRTLMVDSRNAARIRVDAVEGDRSAALGQVGTGAATLDAVLDRAAICLSAEMLGSIQEVFERTLQYLKDRQQFGAPLAVLPPIQHRCADCYVALDSLRWLTWQTAWKLAEERPATRDVWATKFWAASAGSQLGTATPHLHGGMGVDMDYPIHRYFLWAKQLELHLGGATPTLVKLGADMARTGPQELE